MSLNTGVKNGLILGIAYVVFSHITYMIDPKMLLNYVAFFGFLIIIYFMYRSAVEERQKNEGLLSFAEGLKVSFLTFIIGRLFYAIYIYLMFNHIDPSLHDVMTEVALENAEFFAEMLGSEATIDQMHDQLESQDIHMSFSLIFLDYLVDLIFPGFILALVISAITKKENANT